MGEGTVKRKLKHLIDLGAITRIPRPGRSTVYRPNPLDLWQPRPDRTQVASDLGMDLIDLGVDPADPSPSSDLSYEVTPSSLPLESSSSLSYSNYNNSGSGDFLSVNTNISHPTNVTTAVQLGDASGQEVSNPDEDKLSAPPSNWKDRAERLGVKTNDPRLLETAKNFPNNVDDAIAAMKEAAANGTQIRNPTRWLTSAIRDGYKPEKPRQTQPSVSPLPLDDSQVPPYGTPEYRDWEDRRTANASWKRQQSA